MWMNRPKKPSQDGSLELQLFNGMSVKEFNEQVEIFMKKNTHLVLDDIAVEWEYDEGYVDLSLVAAGKPYAQYQKEVKQYKKELKAYNLWRVNSADEIAAFKASEKKRIAKDKLKRTQDRLAKELAAVEAKLEKA
jgi:hypothetical protein